MRPHRIILRTVNRLKVLGSKRKVDFVIAGTIKGGTTALDTYLREHPEIGMADVKEPHFFDDDKYFRRHQPPYSLYLSRFTGVLSRKVLGEATPVYMSRPAVPERIRQYNPAMKIIMVLRNPIERAYSQWNMERDDKYISASLWDVMHSDIAKTPGSSPLSPKERFIDRSLYVEQLQRFWDFFPKSQTLIFKTEELRKNPLKTLNAVCRFLGVGEMKHIEPKEIHSRPYVQAMSDRDRKYLEDIFRPEIKKLEALLNWDCSEWLREPKN